MKIILTGATGFLGRYIYSELVRANSVTTLSRRNADINVNLAIEAPQVGYHDLVVHCAGKAHSVPKTAKEMQTFFDVNLTGTENLLKGLEDNSLPLGFVFISTVAVYGCDSGILITENHPLNATDPYGKSKIQAERLIKDWCTKNNVVFTILRLPLLVGENPPGNLGAMIRGIKKGYYFNIAEGKARKSMVFAKDVAKIIPIVANIGGIYNLTDGFHPSFAELASCIAQKLRKSNPLNIPGWLARLMATVGDLLGKNIPFNTVKIDKIVSDLTFDDSKARNELNWSPLSVLNNFSL